MGSAMEEPRLDPRSAEASLSASARTADILALGRATLEALHRALRTAPEVRENRLMARWPVDLEDVLFELEPTNSETGYTELAARIGGTPAQIRSTAQRLQRMGLVQLSEHGVGLSPQGRQKVARLEAARAAVLRRIAGGMDVPLSEPEANSVLALLRQLLERTEFILEQESR